GEQCATVNRRTRRAQLGRHERQPPERAGSTDWLPAHTTGLTIAPGVAAHAARQTGRVRPASPVGNPLPPRRAACRWRVPEPAPRRPWSADLDRSRPVARRRRCGPLAHFRTLSYRSTRGLAGNAGRAVRLQVAPVGLLR